MATASRDRVPVRMPRRAGALLAALAVVIVVSGALHLASGPGVHRSTVALVVATLAVIVVLLRAER